MNEWDEIRELFEVVGVIVLAISIAINTGESEK